MHPTSISRLARFTFVLTLGGAFTFLKTVMEEP